MPATSKTKSKTVNDLSRQREEPPRKKRRLSITESLSEDLDSASSSGDEADSGREIDEGEDFLGSDSESKKGNAPSQLNVEDRLSLFGQRFTSPKRNVTKPSTPPPVASFASLGISGPLQTALNSMSIKAPTEVQSACIPVLLAGTYVLLS